MKKMRLFIIITAPLLLIQTVIAKTDPDAEALNIAVPSAMSNGFKLKTAQTPPRGFTPAAPTQGNTYKMIDEGLTRSCTFMDAAEPGKLTLFIGRSLEKCVPAGETANELIFNCQGLESVEQAAKDQKIQNTDRLMLACYKSLNGNASRKDTTPS